MLSLILATLAASLLARGSPLTEVEARQATCTSQTQPNPIASIYPNNATGILNGTIAVLPIPMTLARQLIPSQYAILTKAIHAQLPGFPAEMYPAMVQAVYDHDVQAFGYSIPDFSRGGIDFPFVDLLGDGHTSFRWSPALMITASNDLAIQGAEAYGTVVYPSSFDPPCDAYKSTGIKGLGITFFNANSSSPAASLQTLFTSLGGKLSPYPINFFKNYTNQPIFVNDQSCDSQVRLWNTTDTSGKFAPQPVMGSVKANLAPFSGPKEWIDVFGVRVATPFIENNYLSCPTLQGYSGTGSGD